MICLTRIIDEISTLDTASDYNYLSIFYIDDIANSFILYRFREGDLFCIDVNECGSRGRNIMLCLSNLILH